MKNIKNYNNFINEGIVSKGLELLNYSTIKKNDVLAKKYLDMIYKDYAEKKSLLPVKMAINDKYTTMWYKITKDPYGTPGNSGGSFPEYIEVEIMSIYEFGWSNDITRSRIGVERSFERGPDKLLIGRDMKTNKVLHDENGISGDNYDYINLSQGQIDKMISFFTNEYIKKYPELKGSKYLNATEIFRIDKKLSDEKNEFYNKIHKDQEEKHKDQTNKILNKIDSEYLYTKEEILEYFEEIKDFFEDKYEISFFNSKSAVVTDNKIWKKFDFTNFTTAGQHSYKNNNDPILKDDKVLYIVDLEIIHNNLWEDGNIHKLSDDLKSSIKLINLPNDLKLVRHGLSEYSTDPLILSFQNIVKLNENSINIIYIIEQN